MTSPLVSIILVNWNQPKVTLECLATLAQLDYRNVEIIVVDNGSGDDSIAQIKAAYPNLRVIAAGRNLGFTGGNNLGMGAARGDYFLLLNNDTEVPANFLGPLVERAESSPRIGAVSPKIRYYSNPDTIQYAGGTAIHPVTGRGSFIGSGEKDNGQHEVARATELAHGAAFLVKRSVVEKVGVLYDPYFIYYEELDWSLRIRRAGYEIWYEPRSLVMHKESITVGKASPRKLYMQTRNRIVFIRRQSPAWAVAVFFAWFTFLTLPSGILRYLFKSDSSYLSSFLKGAWEGMTFRSISNETRLVPTSS